MSNRLHSADHSSAVQSEHLPTSSYICTVCSQRQQPIYILYAPASLGLYHMHV